MLKKFNDFLDEKNVTSITESEDKKDKKWYTNVFVTYRLNTNPFSDESIFTLKEEEQKKRLTTLAKLIRDNVVDCEEEYLKNGHKGKMELIMNNNGIIIVNSDFCLVDADVEDNKNMKSKNKCAKDLYDIIEANLKKEGLISDATVTISSFMYDKDNPDDEKWYFYKHKEGKWEEAPSDATRPERLMNHKTLDE